jgi:hypothetical protein
MATRFSRGVQVLLSKKGSQLVAFKRLRDSNIAQAQYYRNRTLPAVGTYIKESTLVDRQLGLEGV